MYFFLGMSAFQLQEYNEADDCFKRCVSSHWVDLKRNKFVCIYAQAKLLQVNGKHNEAIEMFSEALSMEPENAFCLFRRAWSYKVRINITIFFAIYNLQL